MNNGAVKSSSEKDKSASHDVTLRGRKSMQITGVNEVLSFDENSVVTSTICGDMAVEGNGIRIGALDTERGILALEGEISGVFYLDAELAPSKKKHGLFKH